MQAITWEKTRYVRAVGTLHHFKSQRSLVTSRLILVEDSNEILYHHLDCLHSHLLRVKGGGSESKPLSNANTSAPSNSNTSKAAKPASTTATKTSTSVQKPADTGMNELQTYIVSLIRQAPDATIGVSLEDLVGSLEGIAAEPQIREALQFLQEEGNVFTTTNANHFAVMDD